MATSNTNSATENLDTVSKSFSSIEQNLGKLVGIILSFENKSTEQKQAFQEFKLTINKLIKKIDSQINIENKLVGIFQNIAIKLSEKEEKKLEKSQQQQYDSEPYIDIKEEEGHVNYESFQKAIFNGSSEKMKLLNEIQIYSIRQEPFFHFYLSYPDHSTSFCIPLGDIAIQAACRDCERYFGSRYMSDSWPFDHHLKLGIPEKVSNLLIKKVQQSVTFSIDESNSISNNAIYNGGYAWFVITSNTSLENQLFSYCENIAQKQKLLYYSTNSPKDFLYNRNQIKKIFKGNGFIKLIAKFTRNELKYYFQGFHVKVSSFKISECTNADFPCIHETFDN